MSAELINPYAVLAMLSGRDVGDEWRVSGRGLLARLKARLAEERRFHRNLAELNRLSQAELDELDISPDAIRDLARQHARQRV